MRRKSGGRRRTRRASGHRAGAGVPLRLDPVRRASRARRSGVDLRKHGSGNLGATNVFRVLGLEDRRRRSSSSDALKGALPVLLLPHAHRRRRAIPTVWAIALRRRRDRRPRASGLSAVRQGRRRASRRRPACSSRSRRCRCSIAFARVRGRRARDAATCRSAASSARSLLPLLLALRSGVALAAVHRERRHRGVRLLDASREHRAAPARRGASLRQARTRTRAIAR